MAKKNEQRKQIEILKAQLAKRKGKQQRKINKVLNQKPFSASKSLDVDPKFYTKSLTKSINVSLVVTILLLIIFLTQDKWIDKVNIGF